MAEYEVRCKRRSVEYATVRVRARTEAAARRRARALLRGDVEPRSVENGDAESWCDTSHGNIHVTAVVLLDDEAS